MEAETITPEEEAVPEIILEIEEDMEAFLQSTGLTEPVERWKLSDREVYIDGVLKRLQRLNAEKARNVAVFNAELDVLRVWRDTELDRHEKGIAYLEGLVREVAPRNVDEFVATFGNGKKKSRTLPHGKVGFRAKAATVQVLDEDRAVRWAKGCDVEVKTRQNILKKPVLDYIKTTGDFPDGEDDGLEFVEAIDVFFVTPEKTEAD